MRILWLILSCLILISCSDKGKERSVITKSDDGVTYTNEYFGLTVTKPSGWYSQSPEATMKLNKAGASMMAGDNQNMKAVFEQSLKSTVPVFAFFQSEPGAPVRTNPNVISVAENISVMPGIKTGCDYLYHARNALSHAAIKMEISPGCNTVKHGKANLGYFDLTTHLNGLDVSQRYYACVQGSHAISIIQTYFDEASKKMVDGVLDSVKVECN